jgi:hypothetical protein
VVEVAREPRDEGNDRKAGSPRRLSLNSYLSRCRRPTGLRRSISCHDHLGTSEGKADA